MVIMLEEMIATVSKSRLLSPDEVKGWHWRHLLRVYRQVGKTLWDEWIADVQKAEIGTVRAITIALGGKKAKVPDLPTYEKVKQDPWEPKKKRTLSPRWRKYYEANNIPIPPDCE